MNAALWEERQSYISSSHSCPGEERYSSYLECEGNTDTKPGLSSLCINGRKYFVHLLWLVCWRSFTIWPVAYRLTFRNNMLPWRLADIGDVKAMWNMPFVKWYTEINWIYHCVLWSFRPEKSKQQDFIILTCAVFTYQYSVSQTKNVRAFVKS